MRSMSDNNIPSSLVDTAESNNLAWESDTGGCGESHESAKKLMLKTESYVVEHIHELCHGL